MHVCAIMIRGAREMERELWKFGGYGAALLIIITVPKAAF
jgi:hypothetical protein